MNIILETSAEFQRGANIDLVRSVRRPGGNALVTALALATWGVDVSYAGVIGADEDGENLLRWMRGAGVETGGVVVRGATRKSYAIVDGEERTILDERRDSGALGADDWSANESIRDGIRTADFIMIDRYCAGIHERVMEEVRNRRKTGEKPVLAYRTGSRHSDGLEVESSVLPAADICLTKRQFLNDLGLKGDPKAQCEGLSERINVPVVVATLGRDGAAYFGKAGKESGAAPAMEIGKVGTTLGGGDWFRGGFILGLLRGLSLADSVHWGNAAAGLHCARQESDDPRLEFYPISELERV